MDRKEKINTKMVINELHRIFAFLNRDLFEGKLPEPAILIQSRGSKTLTLGWCSVEKIWKNDATNEERYEINLVAEALNRGVFPVMATLIHEMVHLHNLVNDIKDTSRGNTYHNSKFKEQAEKRGLIIQYADKIGWSVTSLSPYLMELLKKYNIKEEAFMMARKDFHTIEKKKKVKTSTRKYKCPECGCLIRATKEVNVICGDCGVKMQLDNPEEFEIHDFYCEDCGHITRGTYHIDKCEHCNSENIIMDSTGPEEIKQKVDFCCKSCGSIFNSDEDTEICNECGSNEIVKLEEMQTEESVEEIIEKPTIKTIEVDEEFGEGKNKIKAKQVGFDVDSELSELNSWDEETIRKVFKRTENLLESLYDHKFDYENIKIDFVKNTSKWSIKVDEDKTRKQIKRFKVNKENLENKNWYEVLEEIKNEYTYAWVRTMVSKNKSSQQFNAILKRYKKRLDNMI